MLSYSALQTLLQVDFDIVNTCDLYNIAIKPKCIESDAWIRIMCKEVSKTLAGYTANVGMTFPDFYVFLTHQDGNWIIPKNCLPQKGRFNIGLKISKYDAYKLGNENLVAKIKELYNSEKVRVFKLAEVISSNIEFHRRTVSEDSKLTYEDVVDTIQSKNCLLITTKNEYQHTKEKIEIEYTCKHTEKTTYNQFMRKTTYLCVECIHNSYKSNNYDHEKQTSTSCVQESCGFQIIRELLEEKFIVEKTHEACHADMIIKPYNAKYDVWLPIQLKTNGSKNVVQYTFNKINKYPQLIVLCLYIPLKKIWIFNGSDLTKLNTLSIGKTISKYSKNEVINSTLCQCLLNAYNLRSLNNSNLYLDKQSILKTPNCEHHKVEHKHRLQRESVLRDYLNITYPIMDNTKYDCFINNYKVQDKNARKDTTSKHLHRVALDRSYKKGDNSFYWIYFTDQSMSNKFYVIPESLLINFGIISEQSCKQFFYICIENKDIITRNTKYQRFNEYLFDYDNLDVDKLKFLFAPA